jgi:hypothetical protein
MENSSAGPDGLMLGPISSSALRIASRLERLAQIRGQRKPINSLHFTTQPTAVSIRLFYHRHRQNNQKSHFYISITMDQLQISPEVQQGLQNLSAKDKQELNQFIVGETQKAQVQSSTSASPYLHTCASGEPAHTQTSMHSPD